MNGTYEFHYNDGYKGPETCFSYKGYDKSGSILKQHITFTQNMHNKGMDVAFFGILRTFGCYSISFGVDNGILDGGVYVQ